MVTTKKRQAPLIKNALRMQEGRDLKKSQSMQNNYLIILI